MKLGKAKGLLLILVSPQSAGTPSHLSLCLGSSRGFLIQIAWQTEEWDEGFAGRRAGSIYMGTYILALPPRQPRVHNVSLLTETLAPTASQTSQIQS
jgi:hypothetical protein